MGETTDEIVNDENNEAKNESVDQLRADIEHTRAELSETIEALQEKLSPDHLKAQAIEKAREMATGRAEKVVDKVRNNVKRVVAWIEHNPWALGAALFFIGALMTGLGRPNKPEIES